jgi:hypothetical protein
MVFMICVQWECGLNTMVRSGRPEKTCCLCLLRGLKRGQKKTPNPKACIIVMMNFKKKKTLMVMGYNS